MGKNFTEGKYYLCQLRGLLALCILRAVQIVFATHDSIFHYTYFIAFLRFCVLWFVIYIFFFVFHFLWCVCNSKVVRWLPYCRSSSCGFTLSVASCQLAVVSQLHFVLLFPFPCCLLARFVLNISWLIIGQSLRNCVPEEVESQTPWETVQLFDRETLTLFKKC